MVINPNNRTNALEISDYNGINGKNEIVRYNLRKISRDFSFNFHRKDSNHGYTREGSIFCNGDCHNNLIISVYRTNRLQDVKNAFILANESEVEVFPIFNMADVISRGIEILSEEINYTLPEKVLFRENLHEINLGQLHRNLKFRYGIDASGISRLNTSRSKNGLYLINKGNSKFVLRYRGEDKEKSELISKVLSAIPDYFPRIYPRIDDTESYTIEFGKNHFGLEEFIEENTKKEHDLNYFSLIGSHIGLLHNLFCSFSSRNPVLTGILKKGDFFNESSLAAIYLDLTHKHGEKHKFLIDLLDEIIQENLFNSLSKLPASIIHRDLNHSNIIWNGNNPKIVDSESMGGYHRIEEFIAPLLLGGNMGRPDYLRDSFQRLVANYNVSVNESLSPNETEIAPLLLKYALLKYYVVRSIRRGWEDEDYLNILNKNIKDIGGKI